MGHHEPSSDELNNRLKAQGLVGQIRARDRKGFALSFEAAVKIVAEALAESLNKELDKEPKT